MKKVLFLILVWVISGKVHSQPLSWVKNTISGWDESGKDIKVDNLGNVYTLGYFTGITDFDPGPGTYTIQPSVIGASNMFLLKLDRNGNFLWVKNWDNGVWTLDGQSLSIDNSGNFLITGGFDGTSDFDPGIGIFNITATCNKDGFVLKLNNSGNFVWARAILGTNLCVGNSVATDLNGNVLVNGYFVGTPDFDPSVSTYTMASKGLEDDFLLKLNSAGNFIWAISCGGAGVDKGKSVTCDGQGNIIQVGSFSLSVDFDPGISVLTYTSMGMEDVFIQKLTPSGNLIWIKTIGHWYLETANSVKTDNQNNIFYTGVFTTNIGFPMDFDPGIGTYTLASQGQDVFVEKLDGSGNFIWAKSFGSSWSETGLSLALDSMKNVYTSGYFQDTPDFDPGSGTYTMTSVGQDDFYLHKLDSSGNFVWAKGGGYLYTDRANCIAVDNKQNVYTAGYFNGNIDFDLGVPIYTLSSTASSYDAFMLKLGCPNRMPDILTPISSLSVCNGGTINLNSNGVYNVGWYSHPSGGTLLATGNSFTTIANSNATYYVQDSLSATCLSNRSSVSITVFPTPTLNISVSSSTICSGQSATITSTGATSYTWQPGNLISNSVSVSPSVTTNYTVTGANSNNCIDSKTISLGVVACAPVFTVSFALTNTVCQNSNFTVIANTGTTSATGYTWTSSPVGLIISSPNNSNTSINANLAGTYSVTLTVASGTNISTATNTVLVRALPNVTSSGPTLPICPPPTSQGPINLYSNGASTYTWLPSSSTGTVLNLWPYPSVSTTYTVTGTDIYGCTNYTTQYVQVLPMPWVYASGPSIVCDNATNCFTAGGALWTYVWSGPCGFSAFGTAPCFSLAMGCGGTFTVGGTDGTCVGETTINIGVSLCTNVNELFILNFNAYPNPVIDQLYIEADIEEVNSTIIEVADLLGRVLISQLIKAEVGHNVYTLNMEALNTGIYFARIISSKQTSKQVKIIKE